MRMVSPSCERRGAAHRRLADQDRPVGVDDFEGADALVVIAEDLEQHVAARAGRKEDVVLLEQLGLFETRYSDFEALSWKRPPRARARRRRSSRSSSLSLWKTILSSSVASTVVPDLQLHAVEHARPRRAALSPAPSSRR